VASSENPYLFLEGLVARPLFAARHRAHAIPLCPLATVHPAIPAHIDNFVKTILTLSPSPPHGNSALRHCNHTEGCLQRVTKTVKTGAASMRLGAVASSANKRR